MLLHRYVIIIYALLQITSDTGNATEVGRKCTYIFFIALDFLHWIKKQNT